MCERGGGGGTEQKTVCVRGEGRAEDRVCEGRVAPARDTQQTAVCVCTCGRDLVCGRD